MLCANKETPQCDVSQSNIAKETLPKKVRCKKNHRLRRQKPPLPAVKNHRSPPSKTTASRRKNSKIQCSEQEKQ